MRLDHIAYRVKDRHATCRILEDLLDYKKAEEFEIEFNDGSKAKCLALSPPEKLPDSFLSVVNRWNVYHLAPDIFVSDGPPGSIIGDWVVKYNNGGVHHFAYEVMNVKTVMKTWSESGIKFTTDKPLECPGLIQCFTEPLDLLGGTIIELIQRMGSSSGFCKENVKALMESTADVR